ncbi:pyruvate kinase [Sinisalibacter lacisalsi]|uniref:Pyruvate kinase n=1 Tax=Sinisalibacter lacisalsi TaxID=1526570 RepID=A0ABQ1QJX6_9RHOB|nr:pyruvate kinase [Sinisalibacter lacisalsi]GGD30598.1 pyruvate kinase [Sinisalibacter lacisalsi]
MDQTDRAISAADAQGLAAELQERLIEVRAEARASAAVTLEGWQPALAGSAFAASAENLALFLALRRIDLTAEQGALARLGLSSLGRSESHMLATLDAVIAALDAMAGGGPLAGPLPPPVDATRAVIEARRDALFGSEPTGRSARILVTLPSEAATAPELITELIAAGANAVRINCAHDGPEAWAAMIAFARDAAAAAGRRVPVLMDLGGPKVRTTTVSVPPIFLAREKKKKLKALARDGIAPETRGPRLMKGDRLMLTRAPTGAEVERVEITLSHPNLIDALRPGAIVHFDDGKLGARVLEVAEGRAELQVTEARAKGARLAPEKGVNLPGVDIDIPALTEADLAALDFAVGRADLIGYSFVQTVRDVRALQDAIAERLPAGAQSPAIVLKVETDLALRNLPRLIVQAGARGPVAVMIARGDLAVEIGLERLAEIQEEILWLCEAAEVPAIWATQVLEGLAKEGFASRAEATDAAMSQRAECVMLNKGPYAAQAVGFLDRVLRRMDRHQAKKTPRLAPLKAWAAPQAL